MELTMNNVYALANESYTNLFEFTGLDEANEGFNKGSVINDTKENMKYASGIKKVGLVLAAIPKMLYRAITKIVSVLLGIVAIIGTLIAAPVAVAAVKNIEKHDSHKYQEYATNLITTATASCQTVSELCTKMSDHTTSQFMLLRDIMNVSQNSKILKAIKDGKTVDSLENTLYDEYNVVLYSDVREYASSVDEQFEILSTMCNDIKESSNGQVTVRWNEVKSLKMIGTAMKMFANNLEN